jgi:hypothetical protein
VKPNASSVINVGLGLITEGLDPDVVVDLAWSPPAWGDVAAGRALAALDTPATAAANERALRLVHAVRPQWSGVEPARDRIAFLASDPALLHAGPPIAWQSMCGPVRGALIGAAIFEGWAPNPQAAERLLESGQVKLEPCHNHGAVGPMAGVTSPSMPVAVICDAVDQRRHAYATLNEGLGRVLRFGAYDEAVLSRLAWMRDELGPTLDAALRLGGPIDVQAIIGQALTMGDEGHNRNVAATSLLARRLAPTLVALPAGAATAQFLAENDHFMLNVSMAAAKLAMDAARAVPGSSLVTAMTRNGVEFGLRVAGLGDQWLTSPVGPADGLFFPGFGPADANPDLGDSAITEALGLGGFAMAAAPAITRFVGGTPADALALSVEMRRIALGAHPAYRLPALGFSGAPSGIDVLKVLDTGVLPVINTGIAHRSPGIGQIGAGVVRAPAEVFQQAALALAAIRKKSA